jgi:hypothetical protein
MQSAGPRTHWYPAGDKRGGIFLTVKDDVITETLITLANSQSLSLGEVVEQYGSPEAYSTHYVGSVEGEPEYWAVILFYPSRGFVVSVMASASLKGRVTPDLQVTHIRSFVAVSLEEYFTQGRSPYETPDAKEWEEWRGFYDEGLP